MFGGHNGTCNARRRRTYSRPDNVRSEVITQDARGEGVARRVSYSLPYPRQRHLPKISRKCNRSRRGAPYRTGGAKKLSFTTAVSYAEARDQEVEGGGREGGQARAEGTGKRLHSSLHISRYLGLEASHLLLGS